MKMGREGRRDSARGGLRRREARSKGENMVKPDGERVGEKRGGLELDN